MSSSEGPLRPEDDGPDSAIICVECGNDHATEGQALCLDCLEELYPASDPPLTAWLPPRR